MSSLLGTGGGLGLVLPGPIMTRLSYQWLFWLSLIVIAAAVVLAARYIPADGPAEAGARVPWRSCLLMAAGLSAVLMRLRGVWPANGAALPIGMGRYASFLIIPELVSGSSAATSPNPGGSRRGTSAPHAARNLVHTGPAITRVRSSTRTPA